MIVAMVAVRVVQTAVHEIVEMIAVRNRGMTAIRTVAMVVEFGRVPSRVPSRHRNHMFVDVIPVDMVQVSIVEIVHVVCVTNRDMPAARTMLMVVRRLLMRSMR